VAEKAFRKCIEIGEFSVRKTAEAFSAWRVCGQKNDTKEAIRLLNAAIHQFGGDQVTLRAKITEGLVYHESGDSGARANPATNWKPCWPMKAAASRHGNLPGYGDPAVCRRREGSAGQPAVLRHPQQPRQRAAAGRGAEDLRQGAHGEEGAELIKAARKEAADLMNKGVLLWKTGKLNEAVEWMRVARKAAAQYAHPVQFGADPDLAFAAERLRAAGR
jgi:hypothetical protein